ncbi:malonyl-CoA synthase [Marinomonas primoryensis]|jgi:malonyl-CoA/methylmalonyl-CoA synthetase|uniref:malonate--CoA ligase n=1 Tax=Marinomonas primoryensis TaxID=178399 RepID=UPI0030DAE6FC|tara:strand:+ start:4621 stop:6135 length:1515 start_codon:yes stop_codon:yes gene_type:complete
MSNPLYDGLFAVHKGKQTTFIFDSLNNINVSYDAFLKQASQYANVITLQGLQPGDCLAAQVGKSVSTLALYAACVQAGVVYLPLNTAYTFSEIEYFVKDSEAKLIVCSPESEKGMGIIAAQYTARLMTQSDDGLSGSLFHASQGVPTEFPTVDRTHDDIASFLYTSGTTGRSKGAMLTQQNLLSNCEVLKEVWEFTEDDVLLHALPIFHIHGLFVAVNIALKSGAKILLEPSFNLDRVIALLPNVTTLMGVPTFYTRLLSDERFNRDLTKNMRLFVSGSAPLLPETHIQFEQRTGHRILERYGMTETNMNTSNPYHGERRAGTVGFPLPNVELKITDPTTGETLPNGDIGQIEVRGPNVFKGYWNMPEKTAEELRPNGFFITGDLGLIDKDGYVSIVGRNKDLIISGGYNIYPKEIELILDEQVGVLESAVIGVPHPDFGETVVGVLVANGDLLDLEKIQLAIKDSLARFKHPRQLVVINALPRNTMGKVQKNILREEYKQLFK